MSEKYCPQEDVMDWSSSVGITRDELSSQIEKKTEEDLEALSAWADGDDEQLGLELVDSVIVSIGMLGLLGIDFAEAVREKMEVTRQKYDADTLESYMALGLTREQAFAQLKTDWNLQNNHENM